jgi:hypothetical protein
MQKNTEAVRAAEPKTVFETLIFIYSSSLIKNRHVTGTSKNFFTLIDYEIWNGEFSPNQHNGLRKCRRAQGVGGGLFSASKNWRAISGVRRNQDRIYKDYVDEKHLVRSACIVSGLRCSLIASREKELFN